MSAVIDQTSRLTQVPTLERPASLLIPSQRIHYLDNLRAMAMLLGIFLHSALAYAQPAQNIWLATDKYASVAVDASIWFIHLFRMSLFFLLSGYFAKLVIERKGLKHFLKGRCLRVVVPFVLFYPFLLGAMMIVIVFSLSYLEEPKGPMGLIAQAVKERVSKSEPPETMHLWFLYYLILFTVLGAVFHKLAWLKPVSVWRNPIWLILSPLLLVLAALEAGSPLPAPKSFIPSWWPFAFYGMFYYAGWQLLGREWSLDKLRPYTWLVVAFSIVFFVPYYWLLPTLDLSLLNEQALPLNPWARLAEACLTACLSVSITVAELLLGQRFLTRQNGILSFVADSSYWAYLVHLPLVIFLQTLLVPLDLPVWLKLSVVVLGTLVACITTYLVFVRYTPVGWLLHGKREFP